MKLSIGLLSCSLVAFAPLTASSQEATNKANPALECLADLKVVQSLASISGKVDLSGAPKASLEMQEDDTKPSAAQKQALSLWVGMRDECYDKGYRWLDSNPSASWLTPIVTQAKDKVDATISSLYRGEITFGEFNVRTIAQAAELRRRIDDKVGAASERSGSPREPSRASPVTAKNTVQQGQYQCEQEAARAYPPNLVQVMTSPGFQASPGPAQTNCTTNGNQTNCSTATGGLNLSIFNRPPTYATQDSNVANRNASTKACMIARGYAQR